MHGRGFQESELCDRFPSADLLAVFEPIAKVDLDLDCVDPRHFHWPKLRRTTVLACMYPWVESAPAAIRNTMAGTCRQS